MGRSAPATSSRPIAPKAVRRRIRTTWSREVMKALLRAEHPSSVRAVFGSGKDPRAIPGNRCVCPPAAYSQGMSSDARGLVVVVEDEPAIADLLRRNLARAGYGVHVETRGEAGLDAIKRLHPVAVILDVGLPGMDGIEVCRELRAARDWTPLVFVTARDDEVDRVLGLELGGDDYVTKPFSPRELVARVGGLLRRTRGYDTSSDELRVGRVRLDPASRRAYVADEEIGLTATEFDLLAYLMAHRGQVFSRVQLLSQVWGYSAGSGHRTVDVHVSQIRAKLGDASCVRTVRGVGYAIDRDPP
jgi:DNA-binding response OmpR family regulator